LILRNKPSGTDLAAAGIPEAKPVGSAPGDEDRGVVRLREKAMRLFNATEPSSV
jgi:hypothetical protein